MTIAVQAANLKRVFPDSRVNLDRNVGLTWLGTLQPTPLGDTYTVKIKYRLDQRPQVTVLEPQLQPRNGERLPHVFKGQELCLFRFKYFEWGGTQTIADTIVPWASVWLLYYEIWRAAGVWCGSKEEHAGEGRPEESTG
jgi:hypothetical protein